MHSTPALVHCLTTLAGRAGWDREAMYLHLGNKVSHPRRHSRHRLHAGRLWGSVSARWRIAETAALPESEHLDRAWGASRSRRPSEWAVCKEATGTGQGLAELSSVLRSIARRRHVSDNGRRRDGRPGRSGWRAGRSYLARASQHRSDHPGRLHPACPQSAHMPASRPSFENTSHRESSPPASPSSPP
jgi:hypothetical protein